MSDCGSWNKRSGLTLTIVYLVHVYNLCAHTFTGRSHHQVTTHKVTKIILFFTAAHMTSQVLNFFIRTIGHALTVLPNASYYNPISVFPPTKHPPNIKYQIPPTILPDLYKLRTKVRIISYSQKVAMKINVISYRRSILLVQYLYQVIN